MKRIIMALALAAAACGPRPAVVEPGTGGDELPLEPWEIVYVRSITIDVGDCSALERMDNEVHIAPQGINSYATHYKPGDPTGPMGEPAPPGIEKKLVSTIPPDEEPARSIIEAVEARGYYSYAEHVTHSVPADPEAGCSEEVESITVITPSNTGIITVEHGGQAGPLDGDARAIYELVTGRL